METNATPLDPPLVYYDSEDAFQALEQRWPRCRIKDGSSTHGFRPATLASGNGNDTVTQPEVCAEDSSQLRRQKIVK